MSNGTYQPTMQFSVLPPVIKNLLILNGLLFLAQNVPETNAWLTYWFALWPLNMADVPGNPQFWPWQLVTYGFLHGGLTHLVFNMFALWMFGVQLENSWGSRRFTIFYFVCVIGAAIIQAIVVTLESGPAAPTVGASGGVFGLLLAFGMMFPNQPLYIYFVLPVKAKWVVIGYGLLELWSGVAGPSLIAHFAHLGGMLFGFILIQFWRGKLPWKPANRMYW